MHGESWPIHISTPFIDLCSPQASQVAWRWTLALDSLKPAEEQQHRTPWRSDPVIATARKWKMLLEKGRGHQRYPIIAQAHALANGGSSMRPLVEGMLLCDRDDETIAAFFNVDPAVIRMYHDLFFDVRGRTHAWRIAHIIGSAPVHDRPPAPDEVLIHRVAIVGGWAPFRLMYVEPGTLSAADIAQVIATITSNLLRQVHTSSYSASDNPTQTLRAFDSYGSQSASPTAAGQQDSDLGREVLNFLQSFPVTVADPTDPKNLCLPAREPRGYEYTMKPAAVLPATYGNDGTQASADSAPEPRRQPPSV
jgi:hypothetical protein